MLYFCNIVHVHRYKIHEEKMFMEKESLRSQLEAAQEEKAKLLKVHIRFRVQRTPAFTVVFEFRSVRTSLERMPRSLDTGTSDRRSSTMLPSRWRTANSKRSVKITYPHIAPDLFNVYMLGIGPGNEAIYIMIIIHKLESFAQINQNRLVH